MIGIGVDIISISRVNEALNRSGAIFLNKVFTEREQENSLKHYNRDVYYSEIFASKEAVFKTFSTKWDNEMAWHDIEILRGEYGEPIVILKGYLKKLFDEKEGKKITLSLSWELDMVVAFSCVI